MTTATAVIDVDDPLERTIRLLPAAERHDRPEPPEPVSPVDRARTRPAHCRFVMHYED
ncbi:hypothetical protein [Streptomyces sp. CBMA123]|uniref:hypothetical protein n=1 Tax=Streptomyces sp. CBMA123 TaxID=1896313 RepID=UPI001661AD71|nr:hypothetical protein [Streptomyces sp. CBMA123]